MKSPCTIATIPLVLLFLCAGCSRPPAHCSRPTQRNGDGSVVRNQFRVRPAELGNEERVGRIEFSEAVASHSGDFVIHFHHPTWRSDRNDPDTRSKIKR
ncbi:hypothetical protein Mal15_44100 [Stieleria maiorica]|uniref:Uncharacterized protein n=1 Tax=Stieleria maiorica TaxID=2795974 RepID=A0A5B9MIQ8_9BACT|nr:hypothetical protein [Stieleria maiorica]QEG00340.1 hypothetical protein Mal15_44100 [Stieleria maiorica]